MFTNIFKKLENNTFKNNKQQNYTKTNNFLFTEFFVTIIGFFKNALKKKTLTFVEINKLNNETIEKFLTKKFQIKKQKDINKRLFYIKEEFFETFDTQKSLFKKE
jgi:hypothetical protein